MPNSSIVGKKQCYILTQYKNSTRELKKGTKNDIDDVIKIRLQFSYDAVWSVFEYLHSQILSLQYTLVKFSSFFFVWKVWDSVSMKIFKFKTTRGYSFDDGICNTFFDFVKLKKGRTHILIVETTEGRGIIIFYNIIFQKIQSRKRFLTKVSNSKVDTLVLCILVSTHRFCQLILKLCFCNVVRLGKSLKIYIGVLLTIKLKTYVYVYEKRGHIRNHDSLFCNIHKSEFKHNIFIFEWLEGYWNLPIFQKLLIGTFICLTHNEIYPWKHSQTFSYRFDVQ